MVLMLRLCPLVPFNAFNYAMGITAVKFWDYAIGGVGMIPGTVLYVFIGTTLGSITQAATGNYSGGAASIVILIVGCVLGCAAIVWITIVVRKYLNQTIEKGKSSHPYHDQEEQNDDFLANPGAKVQTESSSAMDN